MYTKEEAFKRIEELVIRFDEQVDSYKSVDYNETLTRHDFIDPFMIRPVAADKNGLLLMSIYNGGDVCNQSHH